MKKLIKKQGTPVYTEWALESCQIIITKTRTILLGLLTIVAAIPISIDQTVIEKVKKPNSSVILAFKQVYYYMKSLKY